MQQPDTAMQVTAETEDIFNRVMQEIIATHGTGDDTEVFEAFQAEPGRHGDTMTQTMRDILTREPAAGAILSNALAPLLLDLIRQRGDELDQLVLPVYDADPGIYSIVLARIIERIALRDQDVQAYVQDLQRAFPWITE